jgi:hypothetical protein
MPDTQLRGADAINDGDLEVGFDERFERSWGRVESVGRIVMALVVAAGLAGLLGRGPFSHRTSATPSGALSVDREPLVHYGTGTQVTLHIDPARIAPDADGLWIVHLNNVFVEPMGKQRVTPQPVDEAADGRGIALAFRLDPSKHDDLIRIMLQPTEVGPQSLVADVGSERLEWEQWVLP